jgi:hypothetical protein
MLARNRGTTESCRWHHTESLSYTTRCRVISPSELPGSNRHSGIVGYRFVRKVLSGRGGAGENMGFSSIALPALGNLLNFFQKDQQHAEDRNLHLEDKRQDALKAMYTALITTHRYQDAQPNGVNRDKQLELSDLWATAAIKSRVYLQEKGSQFQEPWMMDKAQYWLDQIKWSDEKVTERGIDLETVGERIRTLIERGEQT